MSEQSEMRDKQWSELLTRTYGHVEADPAFRSRLLQGLKQKTAENCASSETDANEAVAANSAEDARWRRFLSSTYTSCQPRSEFKTNLLATLKTRLPEAAGKEVASQEDEIMRTILTTSYAPVAPRREFETRLLENLKERQRNTRIIRASSRRRAWAMSAFSSLAAAAMVLFVVGVVPVREMFAPTPATQQAVIVPSVPAEALEPELASGLVPAAAESVIRAAVPVEQATRNETVKPATYVTPVPAVKTETLATPKYDVNGAFASAPLPSTVRGIGMEINDGDGWRPLNETQLASVEPGMSFRPSPGKNNAVYGLGFGDGTTITVSPNTVLRVMDNGIRLREGFMTVKVPTDADTRFRLDFPDREIAIEPGTMLLASAESPDRYAEGGAPAPVVVVDEGGMALARGANGVGPLLANQVYQIDRYVTPDLPSRPFYTAEYVEMAKRKASTLGVARVPSLPSARGGAQVVSMSAPSDSRPGPVGMEKRGTRWVAAAYEGQPTVKIKYLSDEYFGFANQRRDLSCSLALGADVILDGKDGNFYEIYK